LDARDLRPLSLLCYLSRLMTTAVAACPPQRKRYSAVRRHRILRRAGRCAPALCRSLDPLEVAGHQAHAEVLADLPQNRFQAPGEVVSGGAADQFTLAE